MLLEISAEDGWGVGAYAKMIVCGSTHSILVDSAGQVFAWGRGDKGQLGLPLTQYKNVKVGKKQHHRLDIQQHNRVCVPMRLTQEDFMHKKVAIVAC